GTTFGQGATNIPLSRSFTDSRLQSIKRTVVQAYGSAVLDTLRAVIAKGPRIAVPPLVPSASAGSTKRERGRKKFENARSRPEPAPPTARRVPPGFPARRSGSCRPETRPSPQFPSRCDHRHSLRRLPGISPFDAE